MAINDLIESAEDGEKLDKRDRQAVLRKWLKERDYTADQLADKLNVSTRTIYKDKRELRQRVKDELMDNYGLAGSLFFQYRRTRRELEEYRQEAEGPEQRLATRDKWRSVIEFYDRIKDLELEERLEALEERVNEN